MEIKPIQNLTGYGVNTLTDPASLGQITTISDPKEQAESVANQMESVFFSMMLKAMRDTVPDGGLLGRGLGGNMYVEMLDQQFAQMATLPRDPRFHEALVRQIMGQDGGAQQAIDRMGQALGDAVAQTPAKDSGTL